MINYTSKFSGSEIDDLLERVKKAEAAPRDGSDSLITSGGVFAALTGSGFNAKVSMRTESEWRVDLTYIPVRGEIVIYSDHGKATVEGRIVPVPGIKIGDGSTYGVDLPFLGDDLAEALLAHIRDTRKHITDEERERWNNKITIHENAVIDNNLFLSKN